MRSLFNNKGLVWLLIFCFSFLMIGGCSTNQSDLKAGSSGLAVKIDFATQKTNALLTAGNGEFDFNLKQVVVTLESKNDSSVQQQKSKSLTSKQTVNFKFNKLKQGAVYQITAKVIDEQGYQVYQGSKSVTASGGVASLTLGLADANGLVIDFKNISDYESGQVKLVPTISGEQEPIETDLYRANFNYQFPANEYKLQVIADGEIVKTGYLSLLPGRKAVVKKRIDLQDKTKKLGELELRWGQPGPAISVGPEGGDFIDRETIRIETGDDASQARYTLDGSDPADASNGTSFTGTTTVTIGSEMDKGETKTLQVYAANGEAATKVNYTFNKKYEQVNPTDSYMNLGALYDPEYTIFRIWSPDSDQVTVTVNGKTYECKQLNAFDEDPSDNFPPYTDVYDVKVEGDLKGQEYQFKIDGEPVQDPYGVMVNPQTNNDVVMDVKSIVPDHGSWKSRPDLAKRENSIIYEMHVRDFTIADNSGVSEEKQGKFLGLVETGTKNNSGQKTGIDHLEELGITHVQLMPIFDFGSSMYNWGYDPVNYNVPEEQYSTVPNSDTLAEYKKRIREVKTMVNQFHDNDLRVIMDVVYNHTQNKGVFKKITDKYYTEADYSGCGNSLDTGNHMVSKMIRDSLVYWLEAYNLDGFRFDLMGAFHDEVVRRWGEYLQEKFPERKLLLHGEPWAPGSPGRGRVKKKDLENLELVRIGAFNNHIRSAVTGSVMGTEAGGYMFNKASSEDVQYLPDKILGSDYITADPAQTTNYISAHDNFCLWDNIKVEFADDSNLKMSTGREYAEKIDKFAIGIVMTSQGIPFLHGGDEMLRTKLDDASSKEDREEAEDSYNAPDEVNKIDWQWKTENHRVFQYYKDLIQLRTNHPGFRFSSHSQIEDHVTITNPARNVLVSKIDENENGETDLIVVYNPARSDPYEVSLPAGTWTKIFDDEGAVSKTGLSDSATCVSTAITVFEK